MRDATRRRWAQRLLLVALIGAVQLHGPGLVRAALPHVNDCNFCEECELMTPETGSSSRGLHQWQGQGLPSTEGMSSWASEPDEVYEAASAASGIPGAISNPHAVLAPMITPSDHEAKKLKPNCTRCTGCTTVLMDMHTAPVQAEGMEGLTFMHGKGGTNGWLFFGKAAGSSKRYIVKVYCMPWHKATGKVLPCASEVYTERMRFMMAQVRLTDECDASGITPRVWVAPVNAIIPHGPLRGYHVRWHGLWMEEAPGITLHGLFTAVGAEAAYLDLVTKRINKTQVVQQTVLDFLTAQCDRHSENVFITQSGQLTFIDNDRALGVVTRCGGDSMLLPGNRYHTQLRMSYWGEAYSNYYKTHAHKPQFCTGPIDIRVTIDYRCYVEKAAMGKAYLPGLERCMRALANHPVPEIMARYGFDTRKPAEILKRRSRDMLQLGFETALAESPPRSAPRYRFTPQPPCCSVVMDMRGVPKCAKCWRPILEGNRDRIKDTKKPFKEVILQADE
ncbi:hypothetical protein HYH03_006663 [Edaphochlamys debaryana]|uniref:Uncharacterized protein n=1 Tax=Edaphochlamys debaryana TaxID=47281 RepID=A0A835Y750_9CHLO|nr:hypothetical protein HYH03_006663 [Edaphochlamys debaryana]|eukprot:KAG2495396.1 hypothetical protein HYH03_006663 [Edaphochlamys debaryana]